MVVPLHERVNLGQGWSDHLLEEFQKPYMVELASFVRNERASDVPIYPPAELVFNALIQTPYDQVKVVIVGQDPYHGPGQAHGLCFSVQKGIPVPPSLVNIYKELEADLGISPPPHGCLESWAHQGVLLLNATLTVRQGAAKSHFGRGWEQFTDKVVEVLLPQDPVFILWGRSARDKVQRVIGSNNAKVITSPHPSPLSAYNGFFGSKPFSKTNRLLKEQGRTPVDWSFHVEHS